MVDGGGGVVVRGDVAIIANEPVDIHAFRYSKRRRREKRTKVNYVERVGLQIVQK
jgi:hypothetical protein